MFMNCQEFTSTSPAAWNASPKDIPAKKPEDQVVLETGA